MHALALVVALTLVGRPVRSEKTFPILALESHFALEVERGEPFASLTNIEGCEASRWRVVVKDVLYSASAHNPKVKAEPPSVGATIDVLINAAAYNACVIRKTHPSGVSYPDAFYVPSAAEPGQRFLVFVVKRGDQLELSARNGWEVIEKKPELLKVLP